MRRSPLNRNFQGVWIPRTLWLCPGLDVTDKALITEIKSLDVSGAGAMVSNDYLARFFGLSSPQTISNRIAALVKSGILVSQGSTNKRTLRVDEDRLVEFLKLYNQNYRYYNNESLKYLNKDLNTYNGFSKTDEKPSEDGGVPKGRKSQLVEYWNSLPPTPKHKDPSTKVYRRAVSLLRSLKEGTLARGHQVDAGWLKKNKVPVEWITRKWTEPQIVKVMDELAKMFVEGYWPEDKGWVPRNLPDLIHNARTQKSWFLYAASRGIEELKSKVEQVDWEAVTDELVQGLKENRGGGSLKSGDRMFLRGLAGKLSGEVKKLSDAIPVQRGLGSPMKLAVAYAQWFAHADPVLDVSALGLGGGLWAQFVQFAEQGLRQPVYKKTGEAS